MKLIFVCSPFGDKHSNYKKAVGYSRAVVECGGQPITPHILYPQFMDEKYTRELGLQFSQRLLLLCDAVLIRKHVDEYISNGMSLEIDMAKKHGIRLIYGYDELMEFCDE